MKPATCIQSEFVNDVQKTNGKFVWKVSPRVNIELSLQALFYMFVFRHKQLLELEGGKLPLSHNIQYMPFPCDISSHTLLVTTLFVTNSLSSSKSSRHNARRTVNVRTFSFIFPQSATICRKLLCFLIIVIF